MMPLHRPALLFATLLIAANAAAPAHAQVQLPAVFSDHMVLQRDAQARLWGWAKPGESIRITATWPNAGDKVGEAKADDTGRWLAEFPTPSAGGPYDVTITSSGLGGAAGGGGGSSRTLRDVYLGDVWLCSGQSNMEWPLSETDGAQEAIASANVPTIRLLTIDNTMAVSPQMNARVTNNAWVACSPQTAANFSAVGYHFARHVQEKVTPPVPIGLISADWGGTVAQAWMSEKSLASFPEFTPVFKQLALMRDPATRDRVFTSGVDAWWQSLPGLGAGGLRPDWVLAKYDQPDWKTMTLPASWSGDLAKFDGVVFFRKEITIDPKWAKKPAVLQLGPIDDRDEARINGLRIGATHDDNQWNKPRNYKIPGGVLEAGLNCIALTVLDTGGLGGVNGKPEQMKLLLDDGQGPTIDLAGDWKYYIGMDKANLPAMPGGVQMNPNLPSVLANGMLSPLSPMALKGALWYQGESNRYDPAFYKRLMPALIADWRERFKNPTLPFYFVQIAPFNYEGDKGQTAETREAQAATLSVPHTGMAVTMDIGNPSDIHPRNKKEVGRRLALQALAKTYGQGEQLCYVNGPVPYRFETAPGAMLIQFSAKLVPDNLPQNSGSVTTDPGDSPERLMMPKGALSGFELAGDDKVFYPAKAVIEDHLFVRVTSDAVPNPIAVRYAFCNACEPNLINAAGLPAAPFRSDDWPRGEWKTALGPDVKSLRTTEPGFTPIFNGTTLDGWINVNTAPGTWSVAKDDPAKSDAEPVIHCTGVPTGVLRTTKQYQNFILELEYRHLVAGGNAGLFVWSDALTARGQPFTRSVEVQVMDGREEDWYTSDGDIFPIHGTTMTPENGRDKDKTRAYPTERRARPSPEWNHYRVECIDGNISLAVNGKVVTRGRDVSLRQGYICLEAEGSPVQFRNLRIKELPPSTTPLKPEQIATTDEGFTNLFTGVDLLNWKETPAPDGSTGHWKADDWTLNFDGKGEHLWSQKSYKNFELIVDWRLPGNATKARAPVVLPSGEDKKLPSGEAETIEFDDFGDSGIYLRGNDKSQVNIWCWPIGSGEVHGYRTDASLPSEVRAAVTPKVKADAPPGRWNRFRIKLIGDTLSVNLNGQQVIENAKLPGIPAEGPIALQAHGQPIEFANILIRELP